MTDALYHPRWPDAERDHFPRLATLALDLVIARELGLRYQTSCREHREAVEAHKRRHGIPLAEYETLKL